MQKTVTKDKKIKRIATLCVAVLAVAGFAALYLTFGKELLGIVSDAETFKQWLARFGGFDKVVFVAIRAFQTVIKVIPAEPLEIGSGYAYGIWGGLALCMLGTEIGSFVIILLTKMFGLKAVELFVPLDKIKSIGIIRDQKRLAPALFMLYLIPGTPKDLFTYFVGLTDMKISTFLILTGIARIPSIITSTWCGNELGNKNYMLSVIIFVITGAVGIIGMLVYNHFDKKKRKANAGSDIPVSAREKETEFEASPEDTFTLKNGKIINIADIRKKCNVRKIPATGKT